MGTDVEGISRSNVLNAGNYPLLRAPVSGEVQERVRDPLRTSSHRFRGRRSSPGTRFVAEVKDSADATRLIPFEYSTSQAQAWSSGTCTSGSIWMVGSLVEPRCPYEVVSPYTSARVGALEYAQSADVVTSRTQSTRPTNSRPCQRPIVDLTAVTFCMATVQ